MEDINPIVSVVATTLLAIPFNALLIGLTGGSLGKWLFGVKVLDRNQPIGFGPALFRAGSVWLNGLGLGIPIISLFTLIASFRTLQKAGATSWDQSEGYTVAYRPKGNRLVIGMLVGIGLYFLVFAGLIALGSKYLILNAADMVESAPFSFTQFNMDLLCSNLTEMKISTAVAARTRGAPRLGR
jgi:hypothetical protein